jgi:hypothetical protein
MICNAPTTALSPPTWQMTQAGTGEPSVMLGFVTSGSEAQVSKLATVAQQAGLHCMLPDPKGADVKILVLYDSSTSRDLAFSFYNRVSKGEFGTKDTGLMIVPASEAMKK